VYTVIQLANWFWCDRIPRSGIEADLAANDYLAKQFEGSWKRLQLELTDEAFLAARQDFAQWEKRQWERRKNEQK
jgi:hypothetical protein